METTPPDIRVLASTRDITAAARAFLTAMVGQQSPDFGDDVARYSPGPASEGGS